MVTKHTNGQEYLQHDKADNFKKSIVRRYLSFDRYRGMYNKTRKEKKILLSRQVYFNTMRHKRGYLLNDRRRIITRQERNRSGVKDTRQELLTKLHEIGVISNDTKGDIYHTTETGVLTIRQERRKIQLSGQGCFRDETQTGILTKRQDPRYLQINTKGKELQHNMGRKFQTRHKQKIQCTMTQDRRY